MICHTNKANFTNISETGAESILCKRSDSGVDLENAMEHLAQYGLTRILCEGGGKLGAALIKANLVDELILMQAGLVIGSEGTASLGKMDISILNDAPNFMLKETRKIGNDTLSIWARSA